MRPEFTLQTSQDELSRRNLIRKAAYTAPAVFAIAAAPNSALGASGPRRNTGGNNSNTGGNNSNTGGNNSNTGGNGGSGGNSSQTVTIQTNYVTQGAVAASGGGGDPARFMSVDDPGTGKPVQAAMVQQLPNVGSGDVPASTETSEKLIVAASLSLLSAAGALSLRKQTGSDEA